MRKELALVFMAGGISSRFGGKIKSLISVGPHGEKLLEWSMMHALPAGFTKIVFIVSAATEMPMREALGDAFQGVPLTYALQAFDRENRDKPWGTVDALCSAREVLDCPFVVCNGDDLYGSSAFALLAGHLRTDREAAIVGYQLGEVISDTPNNRAMLEIDKRGKVRKITETFGITRANLAEKKLSREDFCSMNIFALRPEVLTLLSARLEDFKEEHRGDRKSECLLPNEISALLEAQAFSMALYPAEEPWMGVTAPEDEEKVRVLLSKTSCAE